MAIEAECRHCACSQMSHGRVPSARTPLDDRAAACALDEIGEDEQWLWRLVEEADRVAAATPTAPDPGRLSEVEQHYATIRMAQERVLNRIRVTEAALARPASWLRPGHRTALARHLQEDRSAAVATAVQRGRVEEMLHRLRSMAAVRADYLAQNHTILAAGGNARAELERIFDDLIDGYARLTDPPAWFRFGLGFPPPPGTQREWLHQARDAVAERRRAANRTPIW